jgi:hypothetical protein
MTPVKPTQPALVLVENTHLTVYTSKNMTGQTIQFPQGMVAHMDVIQSEVCFQLLAGVIESSDLENASILLAFGNSLYFEKKTPLLTPEKLVEEIKSFSNSTPFDRVATKEYKFPTNMILVSINRDFFDTLREAFSQGDSNVVGVVPTFLLTPYLIKGQLTPPAVKAILAKVDSLQEQTIAAVRTKDLTLQEQEQYLSSHYQGLIVVVFILFLIALGGVTWFFLKRQAESLKPIATPPPVVRVTPTPVLEATPVPTTVATTSGTTVTILSGKQSASQSASLTKSLQEKGFVVSNKKQTAGVVAAKPQVTIGDTLSPSIRDLLEQTLRTVLSDYSVQQGADLGSDVTITLGQ